MRAAAQMNLENIMLTERSRHEGQIPRNSISTNEMPRTGKSIEAEGRSVVA